MTHMEQENTREVVIELKNTLYSDAQDLIDGLEALDGLSVDVQYRTQDGGLTEGFHFRDFIAHFKIIVHYLPQAVPAALAAASLYEKVTAHIRTWRENRESQEPEPPLILYDEHSRRIKIEKPKK
jgi:hypothetical protein